MRTGKTILGILFLAIVLVALVRWPSCNRPAVDTSKIDSLTNLLKAKEDSFFRVDLEKERLLMQKNYQHAQDSAAVSKALNILKPTTEKLRETIAANTELKLRNDTLERLNNCDSMAMYAGRQSDQLDALKDSLEQQRKGTRDLMTFFEVALDAANAKTLEITDLANKLRDQAKNPVLIPSGKNISRFSIDLQTGYGLSGSGTSPYLGVGISYKLVDIKNPFKRRTNSIIQHNQISNDTIFVQHLARGLN